MLPGAIYRINNDKFIILCYTYDASGRLGNGLRHAVIENGRRTNFITNGWENLAEPDEDGEVKKRIIRGMGTVASEDDNAYHYYHDNERMDVELIMDEQGSTCNRESVSTIQQSAALRRKMSTGVMD